jgi:hypothetical protein
LTVSSAASKEREKQTNKQFNKVNKILQPLSSLRLSMRCEEEREKKRVRVMMKE